MANDVFDPEWGSLRGDPRFEKILALRLALSPVEV